LSAFFGLMAPRAAAPKMTRVLSWPVRPNGAWSIIAASTLNDDVDLRGLGWRPATQLHVPHAVGIDIGTTAVKATLVAHDGALVGSGSAALISRRDGAVVEQDPVHLWDTVVATVRQAVGGSPEAGDVVAVGVCSQYSSIVPVDQDARAVAAMVMWADERGSDHSLEIVERHPDAWDVWIERHGIPPVGGGLSLAHILHLQHDRPEVHRRTAAYLEAMDFVVARLTGELVATQGSMFMSQLCDNRVLGAVSYDRELVDRAGVDPTRLPRLVPADAAVGPLRADVADQLGLAADAIVYAGTTDTQADAIATGALAVGRGGLAIGTTSVLVDTIADHATDLDHQLGAMPGPFVDGYLVWAENGHGGKSIAHVLDRLVYAADAFGDHTVADPFARIDEVLSSVAPGSGGVIFLPWFEGSMAPANDPAMRGGFLNLSFETGRPELVRAAAEGIAHNVKWLLAHVERFTGQAIAEIAVVGGGARSRAWCQILADVVDLGVLATTRPEAAVARAAGLLALTHHGAIGRDELAGLVDIERHYTPDPAVQGLYAEHQGRFEAVFEAIRPLYGAWNG